MKIKILTRYGDDDPKCWGDYYEVVVYVDGTEIKRYGDWYHDKGREKVEGFLDAVRELIEKECEVTEENVSDYKVY